MLQVFEFFVNVYEKVVWKILERSFNRRELFSFFFFRNDERDVDIISMEFLSLSAGKMICYY